MNVNIRTIGKSKGVVLPKPILAQVDLEDATEVELTVENSTILLRKPAGAARAGWAEAAKKITAASDDALVMGDFGNDADAELTW